MLGAHNEWRQRYNSPPLTWDNDLAAVAQDWADQMAKSGDFDHRQDQSYGENIWMGTADAYSPQHVVDSWGNEVNDYDIEEVNDYDIETNVCAPGAVCGHFTQVVWSKSTTVGCGKATGSDGNDYWVCNCNPPGNVIGQTPLG